jgi:hypothetical protein
MPEFMKEAKQAVNDKTIERPARKIAMFDGSEEQKQIDAPSAESSASPAGQPESSDATQNPKKPSEDENHPNA